MADTSSTTIDFEKAEGALQTWTTAIGSFEPQKAASEPTLNALQAAGLESGFIQSYDTNFETTKEQIANFATDIGAVIQEFKNADDSLGAGSPKNPPPGGSDDPTEPTHTDEELAALQIAEYEKLSLDNLDGVTEELIKLAEQEGVSLDKLLSDDAYKEKLANLLATSTFIPEDLKKLILKSDTVSQKVLFDITSGKYPSVIGLDDNTKKIYYNYLTNIANANGITLDQLLNDDKYKDLLKKSFSTFSSVVGELKGLDDSSITEKLKKVKNGELDGIDRDAADVLKLYADLDEKDQIESTKNAGKFGVFSKMNENNSDEAAKGAVSQIYKDYKPEETSEDPEQELPEDQDVPVDESLGDQDVPAEETPSDEDVPIDEPPVDEPPLEDVPVEETPSDEDVLVDEPPEEPTKGSEGTDPSQEETPSDETVPTDDTEEPGAPSLDDFGDEAVPTEDTGLPTVDGSPEPSLTEDEDVPM